MCLLLTQRDELSNGVRVKLLIVVLSFASGVKAVRFFTCSGCFRNTIATLTTRCTDLQAA